MGDLIPFRRKRARNQVLPAYRWQGLSLRQRLSRFLSGLRPFLLLAILLLIWPAVDPALVEPPSFLSSAPESVRGDFTRCGPGRGVNCVVDGDTFKLGERKVRIVGIDAPEMHPSRCAEEARQGEAATAHLQRALNQGDWSMTGRIGGPQDRYGRDLRSLGRDLPDGSIRSIAEEMLASGTVRRYSGGLRGGWC